MTGLAVRAAGLIGVELTGRIEADLQHAPRAGPAHCLGCEDRFATSVALTGLIGQSPSPGHQPAIGARRHAVVTEGTASGCHIRAASQTGVSRSTSPAGTVFRRLSAPVHPPCSRSRPGAARGTGDAVCEPTSGVHRTTRPAAPPPPDTDRPRPPDAGSRRAYRTDPPPGVGKLGPQLRHHLLEERQRPASFEQPLRRGRFDGCRAYHRSASTRSIETAA